MVEQENEKKEAVCGICGHAVLRHESVTWLMGVAHRACKNKAEGRMRSDSDTIFGKPE